MKRRLVAIFLFWGAAFCSKPEIIKKNVLNIVSLDHSIQVIISGYLYAQLWENRAQLTGHTDVIYALAFTPDGHSLATGSGDKSIKIWNMLSCKLERTLTCNSKAIYCLAFSRDGRFLASGSNDNTLSIWKTRKYRYLKAIPGHTDCVYAVAFSPDGKHIASGSWDNTIKIWDRQTYKLLYTLKDHYKPIMSVEYSPNASESTTLMSESQDGKRYIWAAKKKYKLLGTEEIEVTPYKSIQTSDYIFTCQGTDIIITDPSTRLLVQKLRTHTDAILTIAISTCGQYLATGGYDKIIRISKNNASELSQIMGNPKQDTALFQRTPQALKRNLDATVIIAAPAAPAPNCVVS